MLNLDRFKSINEGRGVQWGDALLAGISERLRQHLPFGVELARLAADEFALLLPPNHEQSTAAAEAALRLAEVLRATFHHPILLHAPKTDHPLSSLIEEKGITPRSKGEAFLLSASFGITLYPSTEQPATGQWEEILSQANLAMHVAKEAGGDRIEFFERSVGERIRKAYDLEHALAQALSLKEKERPFRLDLQPQVMLDGQLRGFEALIRWQDPEQGMIPPAHFIPIAEQSGLIALLGDWVLDQACALLGQLALYGCNLSIAVNVSPRQFAAPDFITKVEQTLSRHHADPGKLVLEVTEGLVMDNPGHVITTMLALTRLGVRFSIDDFGTGYSSLAYLKRLPIDELKIDRSFIRDLPKDGDDAVIVDTIIAMAAHLKLTVVAEGVETAEQAAFLAKRGPVILQGYLHGRPEPAETWLERLRPKEGLA